MNGKTFNLIDIDQSIGTHTLDMRSAETHVVFLKVSPDGRILEFNEDLIREAAPRNATAMMWCALIERIRGEKSTGGVDERAAFEAIDWLDDFVARCNGDDRGACESVNIIRAALNAGSAVPDGCQHEFSDDGMFTVHCSKCDLSINGEPSIDVLNQASQAAFEVGGTDGGEYVLTPDELEQIVAQACAMAVIEFAAAPTAKKEG